MELDRLLAHPERLAHAYFIEGGENARMALLSHLAHIGIETVGNPDVEVRTYDQFGIEESRELRERSARKPLREKRNHFVLTCNAITTEAQNALLKTFEDPIGNPVFFLIGSRADMLLPTLRSRMILITGDRATLAGAIDVPAFVRATPAERIAMLEPLVASRDQTALSSFLDALESTLGGASAARDREGLDAVYRARRYLKDKGALVKILFEQLALLVRVVQ